MNAPATTDAAPRRRGVSPLVLAGGLLLGLVIRLSLIAEKGTADMDSYIEWGHRTLDLGLTNAYSGIYFPVAYQVFASTVRIAEITGISEIAAVKLVNLCCDLATLALLALVLRRWRVPLSYILIYWLNPFFLAIFWLGYVDAQMSALLMAFVAILVYGRGRWAELLAGVPLALLVMLKPQGALVVVALVALAAVALVQRRSATLPLAVARMLVAPALLFVLLSAWIATSPLHGPAYLLQTVVDTRSVMPSLSANMPNIWAIVAEAYRAPGDPIWSVMTPDVYHDLATLLTLAAVVGAIAWSLPRLASWSLSQQVSAAVAAVMLIYPMTATAAHENHLFLGGTATVLVAAILADTRVLVWLNVLLVAQFANLFALYGFGLNDLSSDALGWLLPNYTPTARFVAAIVSVACWLALLGALGRSVEQRAEADVARPVQRSARTG